MAALLEIACFSPHGAIIAASSNCDRIELCSSYAEGGLTPSRSYLEFLRAKTDKSLFVMIRSVADFYSVSTTDEEVMLRDIHFCKEIGMNGIVAGLLNKDKSINAEFITKVVETAHPLPVTFHRAFDECLDKFAAMEQLIACGVKRILTSGGQQTAEDGISVLKQLNAKAAGRIIVVPGGGVTIINAKKIMLNTGCTEIHSSAKGMQENSYNEIVPDPEMIKELKKEIE